MTAIIAIPVTTPENDKAMHDQFPLHTVRNLHFLPKNSTLISLENCRFFGVKNSLNVVVLDFLAVDNFEFMRKIVKKIWA